ncbi:MAG: MFS transporter [Armatimonadota bacterium]|nr:MAG: MFS transporter [Armatimonadota bacterium]
MSLSLRLRLSGMMLLQYVIWGAWAPVLSAYLQKTLHFSGVQTGAIYALLPLACIISPFFGGQIADRWVSTQRFLGIAHLLGALALLLLARQTGFSSFVVWMLVYSLLYAPTLPLTNSLTFHHLRNAERDFGSIRVLGTIGWILAGWGLTYWRSAPSLTVAGASDSLLLAAGASLLLGLFCFALPHTPPSKSENPWAFLAALKLLRNRNFAIFMVISFVVVTELQFYYVLTAPFLEYIGISSSRLPAVMTIAQLAEIIAMAALLPILLPRLGVRTCLAIGVIAWPIRYAIFAIGQPVWLVVASLAMHGLGYTFFFVVGQVYVNAVAAQDIRASAQSLLTLITLGLGNYLGAYFAGWVQDYFTTQTAAGAVVNYTGVFLVPCALTVTCALAFLIFFKEGRSTQQAEGAPAESAAGDAAASQE